MLSVAFLGGLIPGHAAAATTWRYNTYRSAGYLTQDPYGTACTAASTMMMLNFIALGGTGGNGFRWKTSRVKNSPTDYRDMLSILYFERAHDTLAASSQGSDAHGWRNALNNYGWGAAAMTDATMRVYEDLEYGSFDSAVRASVVAIARFHKPVGMLGWAGGHAQVITGYVVTGDNPAVSTNFTISGVYFSDPLYKDGLVNKMIGLEQLRSGALTYRFRSYREIDSPSDDPYTAGWKRSSIRSWSSEWYGRWVVIVPIRDGLPTPPPPPPDPSPSPPPSGEPPPSAEPTPSASPVAPSPSTQAAQPAASSAPSASETPDPASPQPTATPPASTTPSAGASSAP